MGGTVAYDLQNFRHKNNINTGYYKVKKEKTRDFEKNHIQSLKDARDEVIQNGTLKVNIGKKPKTIYLSKANRKLLQKKLNDKTIKFLMLCTPKEQRKVIKSLKKKFPSIHNQKTNIYQFLKYIFITNLLVFFIIEYLL